MIKLRDFVQQHNVRQIYGFPAFLQLKEYSNQNSNNFAILSTLSPALMLEKGIKEYFYPILPRGAVFDNAEDILKSDLELVHVKTEEVEEIKNTDSVTIVSGHQETIKYLKKEFPNHEIFSQSIEKRDIDGKNVVGTLPANLAQYAKKYKPCVVENYDAAQETDLKNEEFNTRFRLLNTIKVTVIA